MDSAILLKKPTQTVKTQRKVRQKAVEFHCQTEQEENSSVFNESEGRCAGWNKVQTGRNL